MREAVSRRLARFHLATWIVAAFAAVALLSVVFIKLASEMREGETLGFDRSILMFFNHHSSPILDKTIPVLTDIGSVFGVVALLMVFGAAFVYKREYMRATLLFVGVGGAGLLNIILKSSFMRERPDLWVQLVHETGYSFPSGHAMMSSAFAVALVIALWHSRWRWWAVVFAGLFVLFVGASRLYLGVHYPTDILAGWLVSTAWVVTAASLLRLRRSRQAFHSDQL